MKRQLIVSFCICSTLVTFTLCAQFLKHNLHMISSVCFFLTRLTIRICIMCRYLFSSLTFTQIWPIFGPCSFQFFLRLLALFEQFRFHNAFAFLHQAEERYQVRRAETILCRAVQRSISYIQSLVRLVSLSILLLLLLQQKQVGS